MRDLARRAVTVFALCAGFGQFDTSLADGGRAASCVPVRQTAAGLLVVPVAINGRGPYPFLLDTGSESTLVDSALADDIDLAPTGGANLLTSTGVVGVDVSRASLVFGAVQARDVEVLHLPLDAVRAYAPDVRGVLGHDVLRRANWLLDYGRGTVVQDLDGHMARAISSCGHRLPLRWVAGRAAVSAVFGSVKTDLVLDSAASRLVLFVRPELPPEDVDASEYVSIRSFSGHEQVPAVVLESLQLGSFTVPRVKAAVVASAAQERKEGGIMPTALFGTVYFDYRSDAVIVTPAARESSASSSYGCR